MVFVGEEADIEINIQISDTVLNGERLSNMELDISGLVSENKNTYIKIGISNDSIPEYYKNVKIPSHVFSALSSGKWDFRFETHKDWIDINLKLTRLN